MRGAIVALVANWQKVTVPKKLIPVYFVDKPRYSDDCIKMIFAVSQFRNMSKATFRG